MAGGGREGELNLIPYLDIVVTLTVALILMTIDTSGFAKADVQAPPIGGKGAGDSSLHLDIGADGFTLRSEGDAVRIPKEEGRYPFAELNEMLRGLRDRGESTETLKLSADPRIPYSIVVATLDAARKDGTGDLYPKVAMGVVGG